LNLSFLMRDKLIRLKRPFFSSEYLTSLLCPMLSACKCDAANVALTGGGAADGYGNTLPGNWTDGRPAVSFHTAIVSSVL
jgi:hypothetical protein